LAEEYEGRVAFVGVSNNDTVEDGKGYVDTYEVPYPMAHAPEVWELYEVPYQPVTIVLDADGNEVRRINGPVELDDLDRTIQEAL
jgi:hypothetical protein